MQRTIKEVYELINEKINNAENDLQAAFIKDKILPCPEKINKLIGEIEAYTDCKILIETSHLLEGSDESNEDSN